VKKQIPLTLILSPKRGEAIPLRFGISGRRGALRFCELAS